MMAGVYVSLLDAGFDAAYLDNCTLLDLDLFARALAAAAKRQSAGRKALKRL